MVGDGRKYFTALITLSETILKDLNDNAVEGPIVKDENIITKVQNHMNAINQQLASYEKIKYVTVLSRDFSVDEGEMTPTLKMKRNILCRLFR